MADVIVKVVMEPGYEKKLKKMPVVKGALTKKATEICAEANNMAAGFRSGKFYDREAKKLKGDTPARYAMKKAKEHEDGSTALVYTANYAAQLENMKHNTLLKAKG